MNKGEIMDNTTTTMYKPDTNNLNNVPSCDIFGYLMSSIGVTKDTSEIDIVEKLYELKGKSNTFSYYIDTILDNIIGYGDIDDYMEHLTDTPHQFITADGELVSVEDLSWI
jgi:hypothetical protein|tara:strand:+ start:665 stop:997 length:333 start_codon:yes stop_codon:yes gene_type:complete